MNRLIHFYLIENPTDILMFLDDENSKEIEVIDYYLKEPQTGKEKTILRKRMYKDYESKLMVTIDEDGYTIRNRVINNDRWDCFETIYGIEKEVRRTEYTTNKLGSVCKISCYDGFTTLEIPRTNCKEELTMLNNFNVIEKIENFEEFYDKRNKEVQKKKKYDIL